MIEMLSQPFMMRALAAGIMLSALAGYFGVFVVQRQMSFLGAGLGHAAFGGIALGLLLSIPPLWVAVPFTVLIAIAITWVKDHTRLANDTAIGIFFSVSVALGILFLALAETRNADAFSYLFGSILSVSRTDMTVSAILLLAAATTLPRLWGHWSYATFDAEAAKIEDRNTRQDDMLLIAMLAVTIVVSLKVVGILLVAAWVVVPAASARLMATSFGGMTRLSVILAVLTTAVGLVFSYLLDLPSGPVIVIVQALVFGIAMLFKRSD